MKRFLCALIMPAAMLMFLAGCSEDFDSDRHEYQTFQTQQTQSAEETEEVQATPETLKTDDNANQKRIIVLDAGHGKSSSAMTDSEKEAEGYVYSEVTESWGEWRHYKNHTFGEDCYASGCTFTAPPNGSCWYSIGNGDRDKEPEINLENVLAAKDYLEEMGYVVRLTRSSNNENPSMNKRVSYCFPNNNIMQSPDASLYVCVHSNAGGGSGTSYIALEDEYMQDYIPDDYVTLSNRAGKIINAKVAMETGLRENSPIGNEGYLILFNKCPVPIAYLEIGFYDNASDLSIINSSHDAIGQAIALGIDEYFNN